MQDNSIQDHDVYSKKVREKKIEKIFRNLTTPSTFLGRKNRHKNIHIFFLYFFLYFTEGSLIRRKVRLATWLDSKKENDCVNCLSSLYSLPLVSLANHQVVHFELPTQAQFHLRHNFWGRNPVMEEKTAPFFRRHLILGCFFAELKISQSMRVS